MALYCRECQKIQSGEQLSPEPDTWLPVCPTKDCRGILIYPVSFTLQTVREARGFSVDHAAIRLDVRTDKLDRWEREPRNAGHAMTIKQTTHLAAIYEVDPALFFLATSQSQLRESIRKFDLGHRMYRVIVTKTATMFVWAADGQGAQATAAENADDALSDETWKLSDVVEITRDFQITPDEDEYPWFADDTWRGNAHTDNDTATTLVRRWTAQEQAIGLATRKRVR